VSVSQDFFINFIESRTPGSFCDCLGYKNIWVHIMLT